MPQESKNKLLFPLQFFIIESFKNRCGTFIVEVLHGWVL
jgi:hypothetical protein